MSYSSPPPAGEPLTTLIVSQKGLNLSLLTADGTGNSGYVVKSITIGKLNSCMLFAVLIQYLKLYVTGLPSGGQTLYCNVRIRDATKTPSPTLAQIVNGGVLGQFEGQPSGGFGNISSTGDWVGSNVVPDASFPVADASSPPATTDDFGNTFSPGDVVALDFFMLALTIPSKVPTGTFDFVYILQYYTNP